MLVKLSLFFKRYAPLINLAKWAGLASLFVLLVILWREGSTQAKLLADANAKNAILEKQNATLDGQIKAAQADASQAHVEGDAARAEIAKWKSQPPTIQTVNDHKPVEAPVKIVEACTNSSGVVEQKVCDQGTVEEATKKEQDANAGRALCETNLKECMRKAVDATKIETAQAEEIANLRAEKTNIQRALNGGTRWTRTKKELKCAGVGGLLAAGGAAMPKNKSLWALGGSVVGELFCHVVSK